MFVLVIYLLRRGKLTCPFPELADAHVIVFEVKLVGLYFLGQPLVKLGKRRGNSYWFLFCLCLGRRPFSVSRLVCVVPLWGNSSFTMRYWSLFSQSPGWYLSLLILSLLSSSGGMSSRDCSGPTASLLFTHVCLSCFP